MLVQGVCRAGVRQLWEFNTALLGKWCWRILVDREGLWFRVLTTRYGIERGCLREGGSGSSWWREIVRIRDGVDDLGGGWFWESVLKKGRRFFSGLILGAGVGAAETVVGLGGDVGGVSNFTSRFFILDLVLKHVAMAA
ncbi:hypothetical protein TSUD_25340 [Trifolium subterraneum]|uniref:Reverse transcriptase zinc-binding domain-containing protein n=1 Tax=Trifolium subterraneum TaxID=3900 RepID=A0A2Z6PGW3_TRISU|nr:hypothetical protein TSUD_25340 [Trifolium subterraneum]